MLALARILVALSLIIQSLPGLGMVNCAAMLPSSPADTSDSTEADASICPCCRSSASSEGDDAISATCPSSGAAARCQCGMPKPDEPRTPPSNSKADQAEHFIALLPALLAVLPPEPPAAPLQWLATAHAPKRPTNSIQSLLCVWVV